MVSRKQGKALKAKKQRENRFIESQKQALKVVLKEIQTTLEKIDSTLSEKELVKLGQDLEHWENHLDMIRTVVKERKAHK